MVALFQMLREKWLGGRRPRPFIIPPYQMDPNGPKWSQMVPNGPKWSQMIPNGPKWSQLVPNGPKLVRNMDFRVYLV